MPPTPSSDSAPTPASTRASTPATPSGSLPARSAFGGVLMGLANLVPGISGGTMLLAAGVYTEFIGGVAELSTLRFRVRSLVVVGTVALAALAAIVVGATPIRDLVLHQRWIMYSLFVGLTFGGVPLLCGLIRPIRASTLVAVLAGILTMVALALAQSRGATGSGASSSWWILLLAGAAGGSAMILPGVSGAYLLLVLGQYVVILDAISALRDGDRLGALSVIIPVGVGVVVGVAGVSNLLRWLLRRWAQPTHGVLLGFLLGAVIGIWPFQETIAPTLGASLHGETIVEGDDDGSFVLSESRRPVKLRDWPTAFFTPSGGEIALALGLIGLGCGVSLGVSALGGTSRSKRS